LNFENRTISINHNLIYRTYRQPGEKCETHITTPKTSAVLSGTFLSIASGIHFVPGFARMKPISKSFKDL